MKFKEITGEIVNINVRNPIEYNYNDIIFQIEIQSEDGWMAQLMFKSSQTLTILREFNVRFARDLLLKQCHLLTDEEKPANVPLGIKCKNHSEYIPTQNEFFSYLWK